MLRGIHRGIEKESLRVRPDGMLSDRPHPQGLGSALTHPHITTDFSESQPELITGVHRDIGACLQQLTEIHQIVYRNIGDEILWGASMPCGLPDDDSIPIGRYGVSNVGTAKTVYRQGLANRYGRRMQTISGIHYNFSLPEEAWPQLQRADGRSGPGQDYQTEVYFALIRNFRRHSWLLLYLFGASPAVCGSFVEDRLHGLEALKPGVMYLPYATSLRMGPLGYQSDAQASLAVSYNSLESYARSLYAALTEPYPAYARFGIRDGDDYRQLSTSLLQIENEFYGTIRPKRRINPGERPLHALGERGVEYVEVRAMDLDPFCPIGINADTIRFLDIFLLHCLLSDSAPDSPQELAAMHRNQHLAAERGRDPSLRLSCRGDMVPLVEWGASLLRECEPIAEALDRAHESSAYRDTLAAAREALDNPAVTPSARTLHEMSRHFDDSFVDFAMAQSVRHRAYLLGLPLSPETAAHYARMAEESLAAQREIEAGDTMPFEIYRQQYIGQKLFKGESARLEGARG
jgi:glutamate--cysteine ligase